MGTNMESSIQVFRKAICEEDDNGFITLSSGYKSIYWFFTLQQVLYLHFISNQYINL